MILMSMVFLILVTTSFLFFNTPLMLAFLVVLSATGISFFIYLLTSTSWLSFILFMIFITAMMVIFIYVASLTSNEFLITYPSMTLMLIPIFSLSFFMSINPFNSMNDMTKSINEQSLTEFSLSPLLMSKIYSPYVLTMSLMLIIYLLVVLIAVAKNSTITKGPLRAF